MTYDGGTDTADSRDASLASAGRVAAAVALLALISLASASEHDGARNVGDSRLGLVALVFTASLALCSGGVAVLYLGGYALFGSGRRTTKLVAVFVGAVLLALLIVLFLSSYYFEIDLFREKGPARAGHGHGSGQPGGGGGGGDGSLFAFIAAGALVTTLIMIAALLAIAGRRRRSQGSALTGNDSVKQALEESLDDLRRERDVRRAIIACYARMERALERAGSARRPAEAPFEYLVRVLERVTANGRAARALTGLFERAKFSVEPMGEREKQQAIGALELLRAEVSRPL